MELNSLLEVRLLSKFHNRLLLKTIYRSKEYMILTTSIQKGDLFTLRSVYHTFSREEQQSILNNDYLAVFNNACEAGHIDIVCQIFDWMDEKIISIVIVHNTVLKGHYVVFKQLYEWATNDIRHSIIMSEDHGGFTCFQVFI